MAEEKKERLIESICIDTLTGIQSNQFMGDSNKAGHDEWKDYGQSIYTLITHIQQLGFEIVLVLGEPGVGKSTGMRNLPPDSNIWFNADNKNPVWKGGREEYGKKFNPRMPFHVIPQNYGEITGHIQEGLAGGMFAEERYAFITGHTETYKERNGRIKVRLKVLGKMATKMQLEGKLETVLYAEVQVSGSEVKYVLHTQNDGFNTARSPQGAFEPVIDNDYNFVLQTLKAY